MARREFGKTVKMQRLTVLSHTVCRVRGHRWGHIATDMLGACDRCFREWPDGVRTRPR